MNAKNRLYLALSIFIAMMSLMMFAQRTKANSVTDTESTLSGWAAEVEDVSGEYAVIDFDVDSQGRYHVLRSKFVPFEFSARIGLYYDIWDEGWTRVQTFHTIESASRSTSQLELDNSDNVHLAISEPTQLSLVSIVNSNVTTKTIATQIDRIVKLSVNATGAQLVQYVEDNDLYVWEGDTTQPAEKIVPTGGCTINSDIDTHYDAVLADDNTSYVVFVCSNADGSGSDTLELVNSASSWTGSEVIALPVDVQSVLLGIDENNSPHIFFGTSAQREFDSTDEIPVSLYQASANGTGYDIKQLDSRTLVPGPLGHALTPVAVEMESTGEERLLFTYDFKLLKGFSNELYYRELSSPDVQPRYVYRGFFNQGASFTFERVRFAPTVDGYPSVYVAMDNDWDQEHSLIHLTSSTPRLTNHVMLPFVTHR